jgi:sulfatase maturation enzyme AslB (radical SAM superfamily)
MLNFLVNWQGNDLLCFDISGGEPTLWPKFQNFCKDYVAASNGPTGITFTSNGSRTVRYWKEFDAPVDTIGFSFHPEYASEDHYLKILEIVQEKNAVISIYLMASPLHFKRIEKFYNTLEKSGLNINVKMSIINDWINGSGPDKSYTDDMLKFCKNYFNRSLKRSIFEHSLILNNEPKTVSELKINKLNRFKGWKCFGGHEYLSIDPYGTVYGSECKVFGPYGNIYTGDITLPEPFKICPNQFCQCGTDLRIRKILES